MALLSEIQQDTSCNVTAAAVARQTRDTNQSNENEETRETKTNKSCQKQNRLRRRYEILARKTTDGSDLLNDVR